VLCHVVCQDRNLYIYNVLTLLENYHTRRAFSFLSVAI
jgi:hypothetical protein